MLIVDFKKLGCEYADVKIAEIGMTNLNNLSFLDIIERLGLASDAVVMEKFPVQKKAPHINISVNIQKLRQAEKIIDAIGSPKLTKETPVCFSTLVNLQPKLYLEHYIDIAHSLCNNETQLSFTVWLEDRFSALKNKWDEITIQESLEAYRQFFIKEFPQTQILVSSEVVANGIPLDFAEEKFDSIDGEEFLSLIPFHLRNPMLIKVLDVVHFAWNCYVIYRYPGLYLTSINNKRHFQVFRKIVGKDLTVLLTTVFPEIKNN
ncbi:MAG: hypothetical protein KJ882_06605 [Proteobacteria bacterium]|nr:hypothetical protein [Pseudomonadota bacterium]